MRYLLVLLLLVIPSCIQIGSDPKPLHYHVLIAAQDQPPVNSSKKLNVSIELTNFPIYLDRLQIVTMDQKNTVRIDETQRWANSLSDNLLQVVGENISLALPASIVTIQPWEKALEPTTQLKLRIDRFSGTPGDTVDVTIRWHIIYSDGTSSYGTFNDRRPAGNSVAELVTALNDSLNQFCQEAAGKLVKP